MDSKDLANLADELLNIKCYCVIMLHHVTYKCFVYSLVTSYKNSILLNAILA